MTSTRRLVESLDENELALLRKREWWPRSGEERGQLTTTRRIPRFFDALDEVENDDSPALNLRLKLREEARNRELERRNRDLLDNSQLKVIWRLLEENCTPPAMHDHGKMISYSAFKTVRTLAPFKAQAFFKPSVFGRLQMGDAFGRIPIIALFNYLMRKTSLIQYHLQICVYDLKGNGYLSEQDLESYINDLIPSMSALAEITETLSQYYTCMVVRKFFFFLDSKRVGRIAIADLLASGFLDELHGQAGDEANSSRNEESCESTGRSPGASNWFSVSNARRIYAMYLNLDVDSNGMLSRDELKAFGSRMLTDAFLTRLFQQCHTYEHTEIDYRGFLTFLLAMENKSDRASLEYFFRILDVDQDGFINAFDMNYFFRDVQKMLDETGQLMVAFEDVKDEIFDMVRPSDPSRISLRDLIASGRGDTVVGMLIDVDAFLKYENREFLATTDDDDTIAPFEEDAGVDV